MLNSGDGDKLISIDCLAWKRVIDWWNDLRRRLRVGLWISRVAIRLRG